MPHPPLLMVVSGALWFCSILIEQSPIVSREEVFYFLMLSLAEDKLVDLRPFLDFTVFSSTGWILPILRSIPVVYSDRDCGGSLVV